MRARAVRWWIFALAALVFALASGRARAADPDRSTPRRSMQGLIEAGHAGDYDRAAQYLDLRYLPPARQKTEGPTLARDLVYVLDHHVDVDLDELSDAPDFTADARDPKQTTAAFGQLVLHEETVTLTLVRLKQDGAQRWLVSRSTTQLIPELEKVYGPSHWEERLPAFLKNPRLLGNAPWQWAAVALGALGAYAIGRLVAAVVIALLARAARRTKTKHDDELVEAARRPLRTVLAVLIFRGAIEFAQLTPTVETFFSRVAYTALVLAVGWLAVRALRSSTDWIEARLGEGASDARGLRTQLTVLRRVGSVLVVLLAGAVVLLQFDFVRSVGMSLLASAGIVSLVVGLAAQKTLGAVVAGVQLSIAQPLRIGDSVTVEGESGDVEQIHLTYVVIRCWDHRRLIVPIGRLLDLPFVNWTKLGTELFGVVTLHVDWSTPVEEVRRELERACKESKLWDERRASLIVQDTLPDALILRALVSAEDADKLFDLRNEVREKLVAFLQAREGGKYLVRRREQRA